MCYASFTSWSIHTFLKQYEEKKKGKGKFQYGAISYKQDALFLFFPGRNCKLDVWIVIFFSAENQYIVQRVLTETVGACSSA